METYEAFFVKHPESATLCTVLDKLIRKAKHAKKHYKEGDMEEMLDHIDELHSMCETVHKLVKEKSGKS